MDALFHLFLTRAHKSSYPLSSGGFPELRRQGRKAYQSSSSKAKLKMNGALFPLPHVTQQHAQGQFYFSFLYVSLCNDAVIPYRWFMQRRILRLL